MKHLLTFIALLVLWVGQAAAQPCPPVGGSPCTTNWVVNNNLTVNGSITGPLGNVAPNTGAFTTLGATGGGALAGTFTGQPTFSGAPIFNSGSGTDLNVGAQISIGTRVPANGNTIISTPSGANILINPQGTAHVKIGSGTGVLDAGQLNLGGISLSGTPLTQSFVSNLNFNGSNSTAPIVGANNWVVNSDTLTKTGGLLAHTTYNYNFGGAGYAGSRGVIVSSMTQTGAISGGGTAQGIQSSVSMTNTWGGTNLTSGALGASTSLNGYISFTSGYTNGAGGSAAEFDIEPQAGSTFQSVYGLLITHTVLSGAAGAFKNDTAVVLSDQIGAGSTWDIGFGIGTRTALFPMKSASAIAKVELGSDYVSHPSSMAYGDDYLLGTFSGMAFRSQGFAVDGSGTVQSNTCYFGSISGGDSIDCSGSVGAVSSLVSGGSNWPTDGSTYYATDTNGGVYKLTLSGGAVTAIASLYRAPIVKGSTPSNPVTLTPDGRASAWGATGLTVNLSWTAGSLLQLNPSGNTIVGTGSALANSATSGFLQIATTAGSPTGTVGAAGKAAVIIDTTNKKLCYSIGGGTWECSAAFTP